MKRLLKLSLVCSMLTAGLYAQDQGKELDISMVISGGVSLGAYESGFNWALVNMLKKMKKHDKMTDPVLASVAGASAGSINAMLTAMYWCQKESVPLLNKVDDNLFYSTWVENLGIEDLSIRGNNSNTSTLFTRKSLEESGQRILAHMNKPIYDKGCSVPMGVSVTKATPITEDIAGIKIKNQHFAVPLTFREKNGRVILENRYDMPPETDFYISIPGIESDGDKIINLLFASAAFPAAFEQVKLDYKYKGKEQSHYFVDGGVYDNVPLELAINLNKKAQTFVFINPSNMRKEPVQKSEDIEEEKRPVGFIKPNSVALINSLEIFQSMRLYEAVHKHFRKGSGKTLILSSRFSPITGGFLAHFGAFMDKNFRMYDYYVGVYDAIYQLAASLRKKPQYSNFTQEALMNRMKTIIGIDESPEALAAFTMFRDAELHGVVPETTDRYSSIYNAFDRAKPDNKRYGGDDFEKFIGKLDMQYLPQPDKESFLSYAKKDPGIWYKRSLRIVGERITTLENEQAKVDPSHQSMATMAAVVAWGGTAFVKEKRGFEFLPLDVPQDEGKEGLRTALRLLPSEIAADVKNGGASFGYVARYYPDLRLFGDSIRGGFEAKASYIVADDTDDFMRADLGPYIDYSDFVKFGVGASFYGNTKGSFYNKSTAFGVNTYVDLLDIFRITYAHRGGNVEQSDAIYFGIENIPSLIYWLVR